MRKYEAKVAVKIIEFYEVEAASAEEAAGDWGLGDLVHTSDAFLDAEVLSVEEIQAVGLHEDQPTKEGGE